MRELNPIKNAESFVKDHLDGEGTGHDWWHVVRTRNIAEHLREVEGGDDLVINLALLLHDVGDRKVINQDDDDYSIAENFMRDQNLEEGLIQNVMRIIKSMSFSKSLDQPEDKPDLIEFKIVQYADRLDALGAIGIARAFAFGGNRNRPLYNPELVSQTFSSRQDYINSQGSTFHHFEEQLLLLYDLLNTETAKDIAKQRDAYMREFMQRFLDEWSGQK